MTSDRDKLSAIICVSQVIGVSRSAITSGVSQVTRTRGNTFEARVMNLTKYQSRAQNENLRKRRPKARIQEGAPVGQHGAQETQETQGPRWGQVQLRGPRQGQEEAKRAPRTAKRAKMRPKWGQDEAKRGQDGAKMSPREARKEPR